MYLKYKTTFRKVFGDGPRVLILDVLLDNPCWWLRVDDFVSAFRMDERMVRAHLEVLAERGVVTKSGESYRINREHPFIKHLLEAIMEVGKRGAEQAGGEGVEA